MTLEFVFALSIGVLNAVVIWLCIERDKLHKRINGLERLTVLIELDEKLAKLEQEPKP